MNETPDATFGQRFADAWMQIQAYLAELDSGELKSLAGMDRRRTLAALTLEPELGKSEALADADGKGPEELAVGLLLERLAALRLDARPDRPYGADFLAAWRELGGPLSRFSYATIQKLKQADLEQTCEILRKSLGRFVKLKMLETSPPEELAERLLLATRFVPTYPARNYALWTLYQ